MLKNYIKTALRSFIKNKSLSLIHITGLSIGLAITIIIMMFVKTELSFDAYHPGIDRTHVIYYHDESKSKSYGSTPPILAKTLKEGYPQIEHIAQVSDDDYAKLIRDGEIRKVENFFYVDPEIFDILNLDVSQSLRWQFENNINSILLSETAAKNIFGNQNPIGEVLEFTSWNNEFNLMVIGTFEDTHSNTHFRPDYIAHKEVFLRSAKESWRNSWGFNNPLTYVQLKSGVNPDNFEQIIRDLVKENSSDDNIRYNLLPMKDLHLYSSEIAGIYGVRGDISKVYIYAIVGILTLLIACVNFINLHTAKSVSRAKEIGVRKVVGASRQQIIKQVISEAFLITFISSVIALVVVYFLLPFVNDIFSRNFDFLKLITPVFALQLLAVIVFVSVISGSYSTFLLSKVNPTTIFRGKLKLSSAGGFLRKGLITVQFFIFIGLLICSYVIYTQINFIINSDPGYKKEQLVSVALPSPQYKKEYETFKNELYRLAGISAVSISSFVPPKFGNLLGTTVPEKLNKENEIPVTLLITDENYLETMGLNLQEGSFLSANDSSSNLNNIVINEEAAAAIGLGGVGDTFEWNDNVYSVKGIVANFKIQPSYEPIKPLLIINGRNFLDQFAIRLSGGNLRATIDNIESKWDEFFPGSLFEYSFQEEAFEKVYKEDIQFANLIYFFTIASIFIAIMGLSGLISFTAQQKVKEIGIRKVLGASVSQIIFMLSKEILTIIVVSLLLVIPVSIYLMNDWLTNFAYSINLNPLIFVFAALTTFTITMITIYLRVISVARKNPVESLRYE